MKMEIGCGARVRDFDGRRYFYFWHYERDNGRSVRREEYVGRVDSERGRPELLRRIAAYLPEGRRGVRAEAGPGRVSDLRGVYLHLEVCDAPHSTSPMETVSRARFPCPIAVR